MLKKCMSAALLLCGLTIAANANAAPVELNFVCLTNSAHANTKAAIKPWIEEVAKRTNDELKVVYFEVNTLCTARETWNATVQGMVDIGSNTLADNPGLFPLHEVMSLPLISHGSRVTAFTVRDLHAKYPAMLDEFKDIHLLWAWASPTYAVSTIKKPVRTLEDIKGMRLLVWNSTTQEIAKLLGAVPIMVAPTDTYLSLSRAMADGCITPTATLRAWKLAEVTKYHTVLGLSADVFWCGINKDRWNSLNDEFKKVLTETGAAMYEACSTATDEGADEEIRWAADRGNEIIQLSDEERARWMKAVQPVYDAWLEKMERKGVDYGPRLLEDARALADKHYKDLAEAGTC